LHAPHTGVNINGKNIQPGLDTSPVVAKFIEQTLQNVRYDSPDHLQLRAENFFKYLDAERAINAQAREAMARPESPIAKQNAHLSHLLRGLWAKAEFTPEVRGQLVKDINQSDVADRVLVNKLALIFEGAKDLHSMFACAEEGPLTFEQSKFGIEAAFLLMEVIGEELMPHSDLFSRFYDHVNKNRVAANRAGTLHFKDEGVSLTQDLGSQVRDELGLPVMLGTSGSSSNITLAAKFASDQQEVSMWPSDLTEEQGKQALLDATFHYMREQVVPISAKGAYDELRTRLGAEPKTVDPFMMFSHSYPEISSAIEMTLNGESGKDADAMRRAAMQALERLLKIEEKLKEKTRQAAR